jgi:hypothetical protein
MEHVDTQGVIYHILADRPDFSCISVHVPIPVAALSVCGLSRAGVAGSNPAGGMYICLL